MINKKTSFLNSEVIFPSNNGEIIDWIERASIKFQFTAISQHVDFVNEAIEQERQQLKLMANDFVQTLDNCNEEEKNSLYHSFIDGGSSSLNYQYSAINSFPQIQWRSEFLVIYSYFEHTLNHLCHEVQKKSKFELGLKDIYGQGIERARNYLFKLAGVEKPFTTANWQRAKFLSKIRNEIAHKNSIIEYKPRERKSLSAQIDKEKYIVLETVFPKKDEAEIILSYQFLKQSVIELQEFLLEVSSYSLYSGNIENKNITKKSS